MKRIYSDLIGYTMKSEVDNIETFFIDSNGSTYRPNLIIPNLLALKKLKEYCEEVLNEHPEYFKESIDTKQLRT